MTSNSASGRRKKRNEEGRGGRGSSTWKSIRHVTPAQDFWYSVWSNETIYLTRKLSKDAKRCQNFMKTFFCDSSVAHITENDKHYRKNAF